MGRKKSSPAATRARERSPAPPDGPRPAVARVVKLSISLPVYVLDEAERECRREGESRSDLVRRALESMVARTREEAQVAKYLAGYIAEPESDDEQAAAGATARPILEASEWE